MKKIIFVFQLVLCFQLVSAQQKMIFSDALNEADVKKVTNAVAMKQIDLYADMSAHRSERTRGRAATSWENAVFHAALAKWSNFEDNSRLTKWNDSIAASCYYQPNPNRMYHADDLAIIYAYGEIYKRQNKAQVINPSIARLEFIMNHPSPAELVWGSDNAHDRWIWCDALYMAPPVFAKIARITKDKRYLEFMDKEFWATYDLLYDKEEKLFFRDPRYFTMQEKNGKKIFWGRGNGWVIAGLTHIINELPGDHPTRARYIQLYKEMAVRLISLQSSDGYWKASLFDADSYPNPETSASGFITYSIWWGINNGFLDKAKYLPVAQKSWSCLVKAVHPDGMLGWVQPIGADPQTVSYKNTETYGAGAFVLCAEEVVKYIRNTKK